ncbi:MAG: AbrB/MazE/SpoVT family DNA-binding domain-containing protein, partial [Candidatus Binatia bacterium]
METVTESPTFQVRIPKEMREALKLTPGQKMQALLYENRIELIRQADRGPRVDSAGPQQPHLGRSRCAWPLGNQSLRVSSTLEGVFHIRLSRRTVTMLGIVTTSGCRIPKFFATVGQSLTL